MIQRVDNWDVKLVHWAKTVVGKPFEYGVRDCGSLVRGAAEAMYGQDLWPEIPVWTNATGAIRVISEHGTISQQLRSRGATEWPVPHLVRSGDVLVMAGDHHPFDESVMVVIETICLTAHPTDGIERAQLRAVLEGSEPLIALHLPFELEE